jgi:hypothetical protein
MRSDPTNRVLIIDNKAEEEDVTDEVNQVEMNKV